MKKSEAIEIVKNAILGTPKGDDENFHKACENAIDALINFGMLPPKNVSKQIMRDIEQLPNGQLVEVQKECTIVDWKWEDE